MADRQPSGSTVETSAWMQGQEGRGRSLVAVSVLFVLVALRWGRYLLWPDFLFDEDIYIEAFKASAAGQSPYTVVGYFYPASALASIGGLLVSTVGETAVRYMMRLAVDLGLVTLVWLSLSLWRSSYFARLGVAGAYVVLAPAVHNGLEVGNLSFAVSGIVVLGLFVWPGRPVLAGLLLGVSVAAKPLAPLAVAALFLHRPVPAGWQHRVAAVVAALSGAVLLWPPEQFKVMTAETVDGFSGFHTVSLVRILALLGLELSPFLIAGFVGVVLVMVCRIRPMTHAELICVAITVAILSTPVLWPHTLVLTLPVQVLGLVRAWDRTGGRGSGIAGRSELILVLLAVAAIEFWPGGQALVSHPPVLQVLLAGVPILAPLALTLYVLKTAEAAPA